MERKVIIRGHVFDYAEKAPFVVSGQSLLGAVEYDPELDKVKCHECGEWFRYIAGTHLRYTHKLASLAYKLKHGINAGSPICTPSFSTMRGTQHTPTPAQTAHLVEAGIAHKRVHGNNLTNRCKPHTEKMNATSRCQAQTLFRIQLLAADLGRTPSAMELAKAGIDDPLLTRNFGSHQPKTAIELAGLESHPAGRPSARVIESTCKLPIGFPSKEALLEKKEPWFATLRCSQRGCIFPAGKDGLCKQHAQMFSPTNALASSMKSSLTATF